MLGVGVLVLATAGTSTSPEALRDPFVRIEGADPLELAHVAREHGDGAVLARLEAERPVVVRLAAVRAAPWMRAPEAALEPLATMAAGRDPDLAPAAALSCWRIARELDARALQRRETRPDELRGARKALAKLAEDETARNDIRRLAAFAVDALAAAGVP